MHACVKHRIRENVCRLERAVCRLERWNRSAQCPRFTHSLTQFPHIYSLTSAIFSVHMWLFLHPADIRSLFHTVDHLSLDVVEQFLTNTLFVNVFFLQRQEPVMTGREGNKSVWDCTVSTSVQRWSEDKSSLTLGSFIGCELLGTSWLCGGKNLMRDQGPVLLSLVLVHNDKKITYFPQLLFIIYCL